MCIEVEKCSYKKRYEQQKKYHVFGIFVFNELFIDFGHNILLSRLHRDE